MAFVREFSQFVVKQAYACLFGAVLLAVILMTRRYEMAFIHRYDFIFLSAILTQIILVVTRLETKREVLMVAVFHAVATAMELFKTSAAIGSWAYPAVEGAFFRLGTVPLFSGFLYSAVGSYLARVRRAFRFRFTHYPRLGWTCAFASAVYINFFTHHFFPDIRIVLFACAALLFGRTWVHYTVAEKERRMPLLLGFFLVSLFIWIAENIGTFSSVWLYPFQVTGWRMVPLHKLGAWYLLMMVSFILISCVHTNERKA